MAEPQTYAELQASILAWIDDSSANVNPAECIGLAERRLSRMLNVPDMEGITTLDAGAATIDLPADFREARNVSLQSSPAITLEPVSLAVLTDTYPTSSAGLPRAYAISGGSMLLGPGPNAAYTIYLTYKQSIPPLSDANPTNWLLLKHPDLYLAASLAMAEFRGWNDARLPMLKGWYDELISEVNEQGRRTRIGSGPLRMRAPSTDSTYSSRGAVSSGDNTEEFLVDG